MSLLLFALLAACHGASGDTAVTTETVDIEGYLWDDAGSCWDVVVWERPLAFWEPTFGGAVTQGCVTFSYTDTPRYYPVGTSDGGCALFAEASRCEPWDDPYFTACEDVPGCCERGPYLDQPYCTP